MKKNERIFRYRKPSSYIDQDAVRLMQYNNPFEEVLMDSKLIMTEEEAAPYRVFLCRSCKRATGVHYNPDHKTLACEYCGSTHLRLAGWACPDGRELEVTAEPPRHAKEINRQFALADNLYEKLQLIEGQIRLADPEAGNVHLSFALSVIEDGLDLIEDAKGKRGGA